MQIKNEAAVIPILIPALEPDSRLPALLAALQKAALGPIILVDDGSGESYRAAFDTAEREYGCIVLRHAVNLGKGRALKDAFNYCLNRWPGLVGCVTADSDGQHTPACIEKCRDALRETPNALILGVRDFEAAGVPTKSRLGNKITRVICKLLCGVSVTDTQTGLRAIPAAFMKRLLSTPGERFEFETQMLIESKDVCKIREVPIETVYDSRENHTTHFDPLRDSVRIYRIFGGVFVKFLFSSLSSSVVDLVLFSLFCRLFKGDFAGVGYAAAATIAARVISATYNYLINYSIVFKSKAAHHRSALRYLALACVQMACSATLVTGILALAPLAPELWVKIPVDALLFFISYCIQREFVYR
ncbi:MAG: bifunctional glycosyltransferase family 2/GtrA family protein [Faecalibacterium sp.]|jgi:glycosyltransferase involved in cell wall biosynthesis|nr:bifunctional glycosyltransferase family 2/GtrA family protein [Faecalibacterium sp.]